MAYRRRITLSVAAAWVVHLLLFALVVWFGWRQSAGIMGMAAVEEPLMVNLQPPETIWRLVDATAPATEPVDPKADLVSDRDSNAGDFSETDGARNAPFMEQPSDFDELGGLQVAPAPPPAQPTEPPPADQPAKEKVQKKPAQTEREQVMAMLHDISPDAMVAENPRQAPFEVAQAQPPAPPMERVAEPRGRVDGGVKGKGFLGFEAHANEMAPYLKEIQRRVENRWKAALQTRYSGTASTQAVLDCAISPNGDLEYVTIVDPGDSPTYGPLCKEAIEKAGPFGAFPFKAPEIYRSQNIEIRWTFSFFM